MSNGMTHAEIIRLLGGPTKLAAALGESSAAALHWPVRGIPARVWPRIETLAALRGLADITAANMAATHPRFRQHDRAARIAAMEAARIAAMENENDTIYL